MGPEFSLALSLSGNRNLTSRSHFPPFLQTILGLPACLPACLFRVGFCVRLVYQSSWITRPLLLWTEGQPVGGKSPTSEKTHTHLCLQEVPTEQVRGRLCPTSLIILITGTTKGNTSPARRKVHLLTPHLLQLILRRNAGK